MNNHQLLFNLIQSIELLDHIKFTVEVKPEKNLKNEDGLTKDDEVMLAEDGSAIQNIEPTHEIDNLMNDAVESRLDGLIDAIIDNVINHGWEKQNVYEYIQSSIVPEIENEVNTKVNDDFKDLFKVKAIKI